MEQEKIKLLKEVPALIDFLFKDEITYDDSTGKVLNKPGVKQLLRDISEKLGAAGDFSEKSLEALVRNYCSEKNVKTQEVFHPLRAAVSGRTKGPGLFVMLEFMGRDTVLKRIEKTIGICSRGG
jgi:glutamyl/glutaminyl-tRNA synthetase